MRFLHTSDWHVGRTIRTRSRQDEFEAVLDELVQVTRETAPDAVLIAGDLFDHHVPTADAEGLVYDTLLRLRDTGAAVVAISGNHESEARLTVVARLLDQLGVHLVAGFRRPDAGGILEVPARDRSSIAQIACVPFIAERRFGDAAALFQDSASWPATYAGRVAEMLGAYAAVMRPGTVQLMLAHLFASGAKLGGGEREVSVGPNYAVSAQELPKTLSYVALGHIHRCQKVPAAPSQTWYSGSLLQLDFGEEADRKSVTLVEASPGKPAKVEQIVLHAGRRLKTVSGSLDEVFTAGEADPDAYLRIEVTLEAQMPGLADLVRGRLPNAVQIVPRYPDAPREVRPNLERLSLREQLDLFVTQRDGSTDNAILLDAFEELVEGEALR